MSSPASLPAPPTGANGPARGTSPAVQGGGRGFYTSAAARRLHDAARAIGRADWLTDQPDALESLAIERSGA